MGEKEPDIPFDDSFDAELAGLLDDSEARRDQETAAREYAETMAKLLPLLVKYGLIPSGIEPEELMDHDFDTKHSSSKHDDFRWRLTCLLGLVWSMSPPEPLDPLLVAPLIEDCDEAEKAKWLNLVRELTGESLDWNPDQLEAISDIYNSNEVNEDTAYLLRSYARKMIMESLEKHYGPHDDIEGLAMAIVTNARFHNIGAKEVAQNNIDTIAERIGVDEHELKRLMEVARFVVISPEQIAREMLEEPDE